MTASTVEMDAAVLDALRRGDAALARDLLEKFVADGTGVTTAEIWLTLARVRSQLGDIEGKIDAIDRALELSPRDLAALVAKADHLATMQDSRGAAAYYAAGLRHMPNFAKLSPARQQDLLRARAASEKLAKEFEDFLRSRLEAAGLNEANSPPRFSQALDILVGKKRPFYQSPRYFYFPELPQIQFYPREAFPWCDAVEEAYGDIRSELETLIASDVEFLPYLRRNKSRPQMDASGLVENPAWSAQFLLNGGERQASADLCPQTMAAIQKAPMPKIPGRTPHALFSRLAAGAKIPPHSGMLNVRLICHLAIVVPRGCEFRVGNDIRAWQEGLCWVFDDTIEHEAWNNSQRDRYILIFDIWRPELSPDEQVAVSSLCEAVDAFSGTGTPWID